MSEPIWRSLGLQLSLMKSELATENVSKLNPICFEVSLWSRKKPRTGYEERCMGFHRKYWEKGKEKCLPILLLSAFMMWPHHWQLNVVTATVEHTTEQSTGHKKEHAKEPTILFAPQKKDAYSRNSPAEERWQCKPLLLPRLHFSLFITLLLGL